MPQGARTMGRLPLLTRRVIIVVIRSCKCKDTAALFALVRVARFRPIEASARRRLEVLDAATSLRDLAVSPGNRLEILRGNRFGQCSMRINRQYRICFVWQDNAAHDVEIVDYHR